MDSKAEVARQMPRYRSHKTVWALEVKEICPSATLNESRAPLWYFVTPAEDGYDKVKLKAEVFARYRPVPGDFIVQYEDGYWSVSPRKAFLEGYRPLHEQVEKALDGKLGQQQKISDFSGAATDPAPDTRNNDLRRWALEQAISIIKHGGGDVLVVARQLENYVRDGGVPVKS